MAPLRFQIFASAIVVATAWIALAVEQTPPGVQPAEADQHRIYESGPLTLQDFQAEVPAEDGGLDAWTTSELKFRYGYQTQIRGRQATARITLVDVDAVVIRDQSWNRLPQDQELLDHEQGHFDLTQIAALVARLYFARNRIVRTAATSERATEMVEAELNRKMQEFIQDLKLRHEQYDRLTNHGQIASSQRDQRRLHQQQLDRLTRQWQDVQQAVNSRR